MVTIMTANAPKKKPSGNSEEQDLLLKGPGGYMAGLGVTQQSQR